MSLLSYKKVLFLKALFHTKIESYVCNFSNYKNLSISNCYALDGNWDIGEGVCKV